MCVLKNQNEFQEMQEKRVIVGYLPLLFAVYFSYASLAFV